MMIDPEPFAWNFCPICGRQLESHHDGESLRPHCEPCRRYYYRNPVPAACCVVRDEDGRLLLAQRGVEPCRGMWSLPGGFVELGESTEEAIVRELREETTLTALKTRLLGVSTHPSRFHGAVTVIGYAIEEWEGVPAAGSDTLDLKFYARDEMPELPFKAHREILAFYDAASGR